MGGPTDLEPSESAGLQVRAARVQGPFVVAAMLTLGAACGDAGQREMKPESKRGLAYVLNALDGAHPEASLDSAVSVVGALSDDERRDLAVELGEAIDRVPKPQVEGSEPADVLKSLSKVGDPRWDIAKALVQFHIKSGQRGDLIRALGYAAPVSWPPSYVEEVVVFRFSAKGPDNLRILIDAARTARSARSKATLVDAVKRSLCDAAIFSADEASETVLDKADAWLADHSGRLVLNNGYQPTECSTIVRFTPP